MTALKDHWQDSEDPLKNSLQVVPRYFAAFQEKACSVGAEVFLVHSMAEAQQLVLQIIKETEATKIVSVHSPMEEGLNLSSLLLGTSVKIEYDQLVQKAEAATIGITEVDFGVAETGSMVYDATSINKRLASSLPPVHIALLDAHKIVPTVSEAIDQLYKQYAPNVPGYLSFVTGPSRTADIERVLTIGVHGPERVCIIAIA